MTSETMLPKSLENCPLIEAVVEIRFKSSFPHNAIFGIIYNSLKQDFKEVSNLPILQIPEPARRADPNLKYKPLYKISNENFVVQIGPDVISISSFPKYAGWKSFSKVILEILEKIKNLKIISTIERLGIRYVNFFENNIFENIKLEYKIPAIETKNRNTTIRTEFPQKKFTSALLVTNTAKLPLNKEGSIIDIDVYKTTGLKDFFRDMKALVDEAHQKEKELFFGLLKEEFLETLKPKY